MQYMVIGPDGAEYGPATVDTLRQWAEERRITPQTVLKDFQTGHRLSASSVGGVFPEPPPVAFQPSDWSTPPSPYPQQPAKVDDGKGELWGSILRSGLAVLFFFVFKGFGLIFAAYAVYHAFQAKAQGNRYGNLAFGISLVALAAIGIGWLLRLSAGGRI